MAEVNVSSPWQGSNEIDLKIMGHKSIAVYYMYSDPQALHKKSLKILLVTTGLKKICSKETII